MERRDHAALVVAGARQCIGIRFRPQGRGPQGMDCLGVVLHALDNAGIRIVAPRNYRLTGHDCGILCAAIAATGLHPMRPAASLPGDILVRFPAMGQVHFAVRTEGSVVEAHVGLGCVVERPWLADEQWQLGWQWPAGAGPLKK